jgi:hypothetical protein
MPNRFRRRFLVRAAFAISCAAASAAYADESTLRELLAAPAASPTDAAGTPRLSSLAGGLSVSNLRFLPSSVAAFPLQSPPVNGFTPMVAVTMSDQRGDDDLNFYSIPSPSRVGNLLPVSGGGNAYTFLATLDSGAQSHILSAPDATAVDIEGAGRGGQYEAAVTGAGGGDPEYLLISDPLGVFVTGVNNLTSGPGAALQAPAANYKGQYHTSVLTAYPGSVLPSIIGVPMLAQYDVNIRNSQTKRIVKPDGSVVRTPSIDFVNQGAGAHLTYRMTVTMQDPLGAATADPAFFPGFGDLEDFSNDPGAPTFWSFPIANANLAHTDGSLTQQPFLFDTGAQVTVLSEETADFLGFDVVTDTPDFTVDVSGVGGTQSVKGFFLQDLSVTATGGSAIWHDVPVIVLNITDPRTGSGVIPGILGMNLFTDRDLTLDFNKTGVSSVWFSDPITPQWKVNGNGAWLPDANWDLGVPDGADVPANFLGAITAARTITVDGDYTIGSMKFDNANSYTIAGAGRLTFFTLGRPSKIEVAQGSHTVSSPLSFASPESTRMNLIVAASSTLTLSGDTTSPTAAVTKSGTGQLKLKNARYQSLAVTQGNVQLLASASTTDGNRVESLQISNGATLDLTNRPLAIDYATVSPIATVRSDLLAGRLTSSLSTASRAVGYGEASVLGLASFGGVSLTGNAVVMRLTLKGDADLNLSVGFSDLVLLAQHYNQVNQPWTGGDFDYDGAVGFSDLVSLAQNYNGTFSLDELGELAGGSDFAADWALAQSLVPEPSSLVAIAAAGLVVRRRR